MQSTVKIWFSDRTPPRTHQNWHQQRTTPKGLKVPRQNAYSTSHQEKSRSNARWETLYLKNWPSTSETPKLVKLKELGQIRGDQKPSNWTQRPVLQGVRKHSQGHCRVGRSGGGSKGITLPFPESNMTEGKKHVSICRRTMKTSVGKGCAGTFYSTLKNSFPTLTLK